MKTINKRILLIVAVTVIFLAVSALLMFSMFTNAEEYALKGVNAHLYENGILMNAGDIIDANGERLAYTESGERKYSDDAEIRAALLHILGDNKGFIAGGIQDTFKKELSGYNILYGVTKESHNTLKLTLDADLCAYAYELLGAYKGCIAICNYKTGELVCVASTPAYDVYNKPEDIDNNPVYDGVYINRLYGGLYTPGSIFKIVTAMAAIENIDDIYSRKFVCEGKDGEIICNDTHGEISFKTAINQSCNVAFAQIANEIGAEKLQEAIHNAGLDISYTNTDRIKIASGIIKVSESDSATDIGWTGVGQAKTLITPYAFLTYICAIANNGNSTLPYFVDCVTNEDNQVIYKTNPDKSDVTMSPATASLIKELMRTTVSDYYGDYMFGEVIMCGKTGTAEMDGALPHAWFAGFSYNDEFPYAIITIFENSGSGLKFAGAASADIMQKLYNKVMY